MTKKNNQENYRMLEECVNEYTTNILNEKEFEIKIRAPIRFYHLWLAKLTDLYTSLDEISEYEE